MRTLILLIFTFVQIFSSQAFALWSDQEKPPEKLSLALPLLDVLIPGSVQFLENRNQTGATFLAEAYLGLRMSLSVPEGNSNSKPITEHEFLDRRNIRTVGGSIFVHASFLSAYESFAYRVQAHQEEGRYEFIKDKNSIKKILMAPFDFSHLQKKTTWIPFTLAFLLGAGTLAQNNSSNGTSLTLQGGDLATSAVTSYDAGTSEEAFFRGYIYPVLRQNMSEPWMAQASQSLIFGAAHLGTVKYPLFQATFGYYLGWVADRNDFNLEESIFIHAWWDFWVIAGSLIADRSNANGSKTLYLPMISFHF